MQVELINSIDRLPLSAFFHCMVEQAYHELVLSGDPAPKTIHDTWKKLLSDYLDIVGDESFTYSLELARDVSRKSLMAKIVEVSVQLLRSHRSETAISLLRELGYNISDDYTPEMLEAIALQLKTDLIEIEDQRAQMKEIYRKGEAQEPTYEYYHRQMVNIEIGLQLRFPIDPSTTMLSKYATWLVMLREKINQSNGRLSQ